MTPAQLFSAEAALHLIQVLALATSEQEIVTAFTLNQMDAIAVKLLYLDWTGSEHDFNIHLAASYPDPVVHDTDAQLCQSALSFLMFPVLQHDPIWFVEELDTICARRPAWLADAHSLLMLRLYGKASATHEAGCIHTLLCIAWSVPHAFSPPERSFYAEVLDATATVVSNHRLRLEAQAHLKQLRELDRLKTLFLASVSHELRTPLNGIIALSTGILGNATGDISDETRFDTELIYRSGEQLRLIISDILDYASFESGQSIALDLHPVQIVSVISNAIELVQPTCAGKSIQIKTSIPSDLPQVIADPQRLQQVLTNLLVNAVKFTEHGTVEVTAEQIHREVVVCVQDTGIGIAPEYQKVIFEPFHQIERSTRRGGTGLGLSICKHLISLMHGRIWVESQPGKGSQFYFSLPTA